MLQSVTGMVSGLVTVVGRLSILTGETVGFLLRGDLDFRETIKQMVALGVESIPIVFVISGFTGMVFSLQVALEFQRFGATGLIGQLLSLAIIRELGPVLTGVVVAGRAGSAIAAEIGTMKVTEQVDALRALGTSPIQYLVAPRFIACAFMLPLLTVFANVVGLIGGFIVAVYQVGIIPQVFFESATNHLTFHDLFGSLLKAAVFGVIIVLTGCDRGLQTQRGAQGVGTATISAVVSGIIAIFISNYFLTVLLFQQGGV